MKDVFINLIQKDQMDIYKPVLDLIKKNNKYFLITETSSLYVVNNNNIDVGVIVVDKADKELIVSIFQTPYVCRLSILSLIESSVLLAKKLITSELQTVFKLFNVSYNFKFKMIFDSVEESDDQVKVSCIDILNIQEDKITSRTITYN